MQKNICAHNISIEVFDEKPNIKFDVVHTDHDGMIVSPKEKSSWKDHSILQGKITIGSYSQLFFLYCDLWSLEDYLHQWQEGLNRISKYQQSCLVTAVTTVRNLASVEWWTLYKIDQNIHVQYHIYVGSMYTELMGKKPFTPETCYNFIPIRQTHEDDGEKIPEIIVRM